MKLNPTTATTLLLETPNEVRVAALFLMDYYEDEFMENPDFETFRADDFKAHIDSFMAEEVKDVINADFKEEFAKFVEMINSLDDNEPLVLRLTEEMDAQIDEIIPASIEEDLSDETTED